MCSKNSSTPNITPMQQVTLSTWKNTCILMGSSTFTIWPLHNSMHQVIYVVLVECTMNTFIQTHLGITTDLTMTPSLLCLINHRQGCMGCWLPMCYSSSHTMMPTLMKVCPVCLWIGSFLMWDEPDEGTGMWVVRPEYKGRSWTLDVIHLKSVAQGTHLLPVYGLGFLPEDFQYEVSLDAFNSYYVNHYVDHHIHEFLTG